MVFYVRLLLIGQTAGSDNLEFGIYFSLRARIVAGKPERFLNGSAAAAVAEKAPCSVEVVRRNIYDEKTKSQFQIIRAVIANYLKLRAGGKSRKLKVKTTFAFSISSSGVKLSKYFL